MKLEYTQPYLIIAGEQRYSTSVDQTRPVLNPATEEVLGYLPMAGAQELDEVIAGAVRGFETWRNIAPQARGALMKRAADLLRQRAENVATLATMEQGKPLAEALMEVAVTADALEWYAEEGRRSYGRILPNRNPNGRMLVMREPVGPVAAFAPWNFPINNTGRKIGAALGAGCSCVLKPAEEAPASALAVAQTLIDAGLPPGVLSIVFGNPALVSEHLLASPQIRKVSFTGSTTIGKQLLRLCADTVKRTTMELGGHAPVLVFKDADIDAAVDLSIAAKFRNAGQVCVSPTRFLVEDAIFDLFAEKFVQRASLLQVGNGLDVATRMGPLAHSRRLDAMSEIVTDAVDRGARLLTGGARIGNQGYFWAPTVLADLSNECLAMREEPFGPIALINRMKDVDDALSRANGLPYGLAAYAFTRSSHLVNRVSSELQAGMVGINTFAITVPDSPFGGVKESGHGSEMGIEGMEGYLTTKLVSELHTG